MKKTFPVNINGKVFYIDEDAYELLLNYLDQLRSAFGGAEGEEIVSDIESRISELFDERIAAGACAIVYNDVNNVIEIMGKPSDISDCEPESPEQDEPAVNQFQADSLIPVSYVEAWITCPFPIYIATWLMRPPLA